MVMGKMMNSQLRPPKEVTISGAISLLGSNFGQHVIFRVNPPQRVPGLKGACNTEKEVLREFVKSSVLSDRNHWKNALRNHREQALGSRRLWTGATGNELQT